MIRPRRVLPSADGDATLVATAAAYAEGRLDAESTVAFERRLAGDQAARDALVAAMEELSNGASPDPRWRATVRAKLRAIGWGARGRWAGVGAAAVAAAAAVAFLMLNAPRPDVGAVAGGNGPAASTAD